MKDLLTLIVILLVTTVITYFGHGFILNNFDSSSWHQNDRVVTYSCSLLFSGLGFIVYKG